MTHLVAVSDQEKGIAALIEPLIQKHALSLVCVRADDHLVQVFVDKADPASGGVTARDCELFSKQAAVILASHIPEHSHFIVSSPGLDRELTRAEDFTTFAQAQVSVRNQGQKKPILGKLLGLKDDSLLIHVEDEEIVIPFDNVREVRLV